MPKKSTKTASRRKITAHDLEKFLLVADPQVSPDGAKILFTRKHTGDKNNTVANLWIVDTDGGKPRQFTSGGKDGHGRWSPDGETIAFVSDRDDHPQIFTMPATGGEAVPLTEFPEGTIGGFKWSPDGNSLAVQFRETDPEWTKEAKEKRKETGGSTPARVIDQLYYRLDGDGYFNKQRFRLHIVDVADGGRRELYAKDSIGWFSYDWSPDSSELVVGTHTGREAFIKFWKWDIVRIKAKTGKVTKLKNLPEGEKSAVCWSPDGKRIAYAGREGRDTWGVKNTHLYVCDADGGNLKNLTGNTDYCLMAITLSDSAEAEFDANIRFSPDSRRILMNFGWQGETHISSVPVDGGEVTFHTSGRKSIGMGNLSADGQLAAVMVGDQTSLPEIGYATVVAPLIKGGTARVARNVQTLTRFNRPLLKQLEVSKPEPHWIESASGTKVHLWLMKPPGFKKTRKYPAILEIHGGPHTQYGEAFFHEMQTFAAAGFVVVFSNPRGSKGYGEDHCTAIEGKWGAADWEDVQAVTTFMQKQSFIDNNRLGVCGGSYGGYMTNWVIGHTNEFAAAVTDRCVSNLVSMAGSSDIPLVPGEYWPGNAWSEPEELWNQSPMKYMGNAETPTLVVHSEGDLRCNVEQSEQVFTALKLRGIPTRFVRYPFSTSHGLSRKGPADLRIHRLGQYLDWWSRYLKD